jgi:hypothetical protein
MCNWFNILNLTKGRTMALYEFEGKRPSIGASSFIPPWDRLQGHLPRWEDITGRWCENRDRGQVSGFWSDVCRFEIGEKAKDI